MKMSRQPQLKPMEEKENAPAPKQEAKQDEKIKVIPSDVYNYEALQYQTNLLENINNGIGSLISSNLTIINCLKQAGFKVE